MRLFGEHLVNDSKGVFALALLKIFWSADDLEASSEAKGLVAYCTSVINNIRSITYSMHQCTHWFVTAASLEDLAYECSFLSVSFSSSVIFVLHNQWVEPWTCQVDFAVLLVKVFILKA